MGILISLTPYETGLAQGQLFHADNLYKRGTMPSRVCPRAEVRDQVQHDSTNYKTIQDIRFARYNVIS